MKNVTNKLRVCHFPQIGSCKKAFNVDVKDEQEAYKIYNVLADQHLWLFKNKIIPDYSNVILVEMFDENINTETNLPFGWCDYYNEEESMEWGDVEEHFLNVKA